jgi:hypothetical protein
LIFLSGRPGKRAAAEQVQMQVEDGLARSGADVVDRSVAALYAPLASQFGRHQLAITDQLRIRFLRFFEVYNVSLGDDEQVSGGLRIDVLENESLIIFVNFPGWHITGDNLAEEAVSHKMK